MEAFELLARLGHVEPADAAVLDRAEAEFLAAAGGPGPARLVRAAGAGGAAPRATATDGGGEARRQRRRALRLSVAASAAAATVAVAAGIALASASRPAHPALPPASGHGSRVPAGTPLGKAVLIAFNAHADDILYIRKRQTGASPNLDRRMWLWPIQPAPGQQQRFRSQNLSADGRLRGDWAITYLAGPAASVPSAPDNCGMVVTPPRPQTGHVQGHLLSVMPHGKVWLETTLRTTRATIAPLRACLAQGHWRLAGQGDVNGVHALEYTDASVPASGLLLWVDPQTYLPVRLISHFAVGGRILVDRFDYQFLSPTPANLAKLRPQIPPGFKRVHWPV